MMNSDKNEGDYLFLILSSCSVTLLQIPCERFSFTTVHSIRPFIHSSSVITAVLHTIFSHTVTSIS
jgi:hypothetical protein